VVSITYLLQIGLNYIVSTLTLTEYHSNIITSKLVIKKSPISTHIE